MASSSAAGFRRRFRVVSPWRRLAVFGAAASLAALRIGCEPEPPNVAPLAPLHPGAYRVAQVVDGDTLELTTGHRIRLLGIDTPETVQPNRPPEPWGAEATEFAKRWVTASAGAVRLSFDDERFDRYGRQLAWVWRDAELLNEQLVRAGLSPALTKYPYSPTMKDRLRAAEREAKRERRGIWSQPAAK